MSKTGRVHELKSWLVYFNATIRGMKKFEVRYNDRHYLEGDELVLKEFDPHLRIYTGRQVRADVTYVMPLEPLGIAPGFVVLAIGPLRDLVA